MGFNSMTWGVKASFRGYVEAAGGTIALDEGAEQAADGAFVFAALPGGDLAIDAAGAVTGSMRFQGSVAFEAHGGMLKAVIKEIAIEAGDDGPLLTVLDTQFDDGRCAIATLGPVTLNADGSATMGSAITMDGMYQIADNYPPGTELDPLRLE